MYQEKIKSKPGYYITNNNHNNKSFDFNCYVWDNPTHNRKRTNERGHKKTNTRNERRGFISYYLLC